MNGSKSMTVEVQFSELFVGTTWPGPYSCQWTDMILHKEEAFLVCLSQGGCSFWWMNPLQFGIPILQDMAIGVFLWALRIYKGSIMQTGTTHLMWCVDELTLEDQGPKSHPTLRTLRTNPPAPKVTTTTTMSSCKGIGVKELLESWSFLAAPVSDVYRWPNILKTNKVNMDLAGLGNGCEMVQLALEIWIGTHGICRE